MTPHNNAGVKSRGGQLPGGLSNPHPHQMQIQARNIRTLHPEIAGIPDVRQGWAIVAMGARN